MSTSSTIDRNTAEALVRRALANANENWQRPELNDVAADFDLFDVLDSFAVVELLLQTEGEAEKLVGKYIPLASEAVLDSVKSPLRSFDSWVDYVNETIRNG